MAASLAGPIVVGATGGSGTRVVAEILERSGCFIGTNLNYARDNMDFSFCLSGDVAWARANFPHYPSPTLEWRLTLFERLFFGRFIGWGLVPAFARLALGFLIRGDNRSALKTRPAWERIENAARLFAPWIPRRSLAEGDWRAWGFKDTDSLFFLPALAERWPEMRLVHVLRDGRDMAFSGQKKSYLYYGRAMGLSGPPTPGNLLEFWARSNQWAHHMATRLLGADRVLTVRFEDLCADPDATIARILAFAGLRNRDPSLGALPKAPASVGRWRMDPAAVAGIAEEQLRFFGYG